MPRWWRKCMSLWGRESAQATWKHRSLVTELSRDRAVNSAFAHAWDALVRQTAGAPRGRGCCWGLLGQQWAGLLHGVIHQPGNKGQGGCRGLVQLELSHRNELSPVVVALQPATWRLCCYANQVMCACCPGCMQIADLREGDLLTDAERQHCSYMRLAEQGAAWSQWPEAAQHVSPLIRPAFFYAGQAQKVVDTGSVGAVQVAVLQQLRSLALLLGVELQLLTGQQVRGGGARLGEEQRDGGRGKRGEGEGKGEGKEDWARGAGASGRTTPRVQALSRRQFLSGITT